MEFVQGTVDRLRRGEGVRRDLELKKGLEDTMYLPTLSVGFGISGVPDTDNEG
jgi:hypothetical protein